MRRVLLAAAAPLALAAALSAACGDGGDAKKLIVFEGRHESGATNIYTVDPDSAKVRQLTKGEGFIGNPAWSPDRRRILHVGRRDGQRLNDLYVMDAGGGAVRRLTDTPDVEEWSPKYSLDGARIAYALRAPDGWHLALAEPDGSGEQRIAGPYDFLEFPTWRPGGKEIWFSAKESSRPYADIFSVDLATERVTARIATPGADVCPHFTHDGTTLTYATTPPGDDSNMELWAHDPSSGDATGAGDRRLTDSPGKDDYGNPSPDDALIVFVSERGGEADLYLMDRDGSDPRLLAETPEIYENVPDW